MMFRSTITHKPSDRRYSAGFLATLALFTLGAAFVIPAPLAHAQSSKKVRTIKFTLVFTRPGEYQCYPIINGAKAEGINIVPGQNKLPVEVSTNIDGIEVLDRVSGLVAAIPLRKIRRNSRVPVEPEDFNQLQAVVIKLNSLNGKPAAKGIVQLKPSRGELLQYSLTTMDGGSVRFENIPLGTAQLKAHALTGDDVVKKTVVIAPARGGGERTYTLTLPIDVRTVEPTPAPNATPKPEPKKPEPKNDWLSGLIGLGILGGGGVFALRYLKSRNMTPKDALAGAMKSLGVDAPGAPVMGEHAGLRPSAPDVVQAPLASLSDLPAAPLVAAPIVVELPRAMPGAHLVGLAGAVAGQAIAMKSDTESMVTVGRDPKSTIPLPNDSMVSRRHAVFVANGAGWDLMDEASTNGTFLNGKRVENRTALMNGDEIQIGMARFRFEGERRGQTPQPKVMQA